MTRELEVLNAVIVPDGAVIDMAVRASDEISGHFPAQIKLDRGSFIPHITLYQAQYPARNLGRVKEELKRVAGGTKAFGVELGDVVVELDTYVFWKCKKNSGLQHLHNLLVDALNPLRDGLVLPHLARVTGMNEEDKADMGKYGNIFMKKRYMPHITLSRLSERQELERILKVIGKNTEISFIAESIVLGKVGEGGTLTEKVDEFPLKKN